MTKDLKPHGSFTTSTNNNSLLENFHNTAAQNFSSDVNKSSEDIAREMEAKAGNLGFGIGRFFSNNPIVKAVAGLFSSDDKIPSSPTSSETNRKLLQTSNTTDLSNLPAHCQGIINALNLTDTDKEFLLNATYNLIDTLTPEKVDKINNYLVNIPSGNLDEASAVIAESFAGISKKQAKDFLEGLRDVSHRPWEFRTYLETCIERNLNLTHSPTQAPTKNPTQSPTTAAPTPPTNQPTKQPTPQFTVGETIGIGFGGFFGGLLVLVCCCKGIGAAIEAIEDCADKRKSAKQVAPTELDEVVKEKRPATSAATPSAVIVQSLNTSRQ